METHCIYYIDWVGISLGEGWISDVYRYAEMDQRWCVLYILYHQLRSSESKSPSTDSSPFLEPLSTYRTGTIKSEKLKHKRSSSRQKENHLPSHWLANTSILNLGISPQRISKLRSREDNHFLGRILVVCSFLTNPPHTFVAIASTTPTFCSSRTPPNLLHAFHNPRPGHFFRQRSPPPSIAPISP